MSDWLAHGLVAGARLALVSFGFGLVYFTTGVFHFAHGAVYAVAAYAGWYSRTALEWSWSLSLVTGLAAGTLLSWLVDTGLYRPLRRREAAPDVLFLTSLGAFTAVTNLLAALFGQETQSLGLRQASYELRAASALSPPLVLTTSQIATVLLAACCFLLLWLVFVRTRFGLALRAYAARPTLAHALGIDRERLLPAVAALAGLVAAVAALLQAADVGIPQGYPDYVLHTMVRVVKGGEEVKISKRAGSYV
ncbi:MAG: hypothetical protein HUU35_18930, partial [Armatimonadetes bacterium]|nr:hypothetical protein [Armatimonadota bacterium]